MMRKYLLTLVVLALVAAGARVAAAQEGKMTAKPAVQKGTVETGPNLTGVQVGNTVCPVMGTPIVEKYAVKVKYHGKIYNLCCTSCLKEFEANPAKYAAIADASVAGKKAAGKSAAEGVRSMSGSMQGSMTGGMKGMTKVK
jgi:YHS domain-containing protein